MHSIRASRLPVAIVAGLLALAACAPPADDGTPVPEEQDAAKAAMEAQLQAVHFQPGTQVHKLPMNGKKSEATVAPLAANMLSYFGGRVISNVRVVQVLYGSGTYIPEISGANMGNFYTQSTNSAYMDWLTEYNTTGHSPGTNQTIGRGTFQSKVQITPSSAHNGSTIDDSAIQAEIAAQISAGTLPAPTTDAAGNVNTLYMVNFPAGKTITQGGSNSCQAGGFCAYHGTFAMGSQHLYYGVLPDMSSSSGCASGCGTSTTFNNQTSVASHEMIEAVTDAEVGLATVVGPPLAWYNNSQGEIGDICNAQQGTIVGGDGVTYTVQKEYDNATGTCIVSKSTSTNDFSISASPTSATVAPGNSTTFTISTATISGSAQTVNLTASGAPSGATATLSPTSVTSGGSSTLTFNSGTAASGTYTVTVTGTGSSATHATSVSITISGGGGGSVLSNGVPVTGLSGATNAQQNFTMAVPAGASGLSFTISGGTGDADLYVKFGSAPTLSSYDCRPFVSGNAESCSFATPQTGTYFVMLNGFAAYSGVTLTGSYSTGGGGGGALQNGGFEGSLSPWTASGATWSNGSYPHTGTGYAILGGANSVTHTLYQTIAVPTTGNGLTFWLNVTTAETTTVTQYDKINVEVRNTSGTLLSTLGTYSNLNGGTAGVYSQKSFSLAPWAGQTIRLQFTATCDSSLITTFRVDDVAVH
jgi:pre-peptidase